MLHTPTYTHTLTHILLPTRDLFSNILLSLLSHLAGDLAVFSRLKGAYTGWEYLEHRRSLNWVFKGNPFRKFFNVMLIHGRKHVLYSYMIARKRYINKKIRCYSKMPLTKHTSFIKNNKNNLTKLKITWLMCKLSHILSVLQYLKLWTSLLILYFNALAWIHLNVK
jgi:hypothetical protein